MSVSITLNVNGVAYPVNVEPGTALARERDPRRGRPDRHQGGLRRLASAAPAGCWSTAGR